MSVLVPPPTARPAADAACVCRIRDVWKAFDATVVFRGLDLELLRGETLAILGPSGCGKSVLLKMMIGLVPMDRGSIAFDGVELGTMDPPALRGLRQRVGMVFQAAALFDSISVGDNVAYSLRELYADTMTEAEILARVAWALASVAMPDSEALMPTTLSGGMRKRVGIARTIADRPEVILYDEPTTGLDPINSSRIAHLIARLQKQLRVTSVIVTHDLSLAFTVADRIGMIRDGRLAALGTVAAIRASTDPDVQDFIQGRARGDEPERVASLAPSDPHARP